MSSTRKNTSTVPKFIIYTAQFLQAISSKLTVQFANKLFITPIKHRIPKREFEMEQNTQQNFLLVSSIGKQIRTYQYGNSPKKALLVHGWSGRGTQLVKIADMLLEMGYSIISFDAPAHGKSPGKTSIMLEFIESILELEKQFGSFEFCIGHSLGGMSTLNAIKKGLQVKKAVIIGSGDSVHDILYDFVKKLHLKPIIANKMRIDFEQKHQINMENYSGYVAAQSITTPILVLHDKNDDDVPYTASENIHKHLNNSNLVLTENLGHRKILGNPEVLEIIKQFLLDNN